MAIQKGFLYKSAKLSEKSLKVVLVVVKKSLQKLSKKGLKDLCVFSKCLVAVLSRFGSPHLRWVVLHSKQN